MTTLGEEEKLSTDPSGSEVTLDSVVHVGQVIQLEFGPLTDLCPVFCADLVFCFCHWSE